jgi:heat shock protein HslJ
MYIPNLRLVLFLAASLAIACSGSSPSPTSPSGTIPGGAQSLTADALAGTWTLVSLQPTKQREQPVPAGVSYTLTFSGDRVSTRVDCNSCGGVFTLSGQTLTVGPALACTRAACSTMAFENSYTSVLSGDSTVSLSGGALALSSSRGTLRFAR